MARPLASQKNDPFAHLRVIDYLLAETMYVKDLFGGPNAGKPYSQT